MYLFVRKAVVLCHALDKLRSVPNLYFSIHHSIWLSLVSSIVHGLNTSLKKGRDQRCKPQRNTPMIYLLYLIFCTQILGSLAGKKN